MAEPNPSINRAVHAARAAQSDWQTEAATALREASGICGSQCQGLWCNKFFHAAAASCATFSMRAIEPRNATGTAMLASPLR